MTSTWFLPAFCVFLLFGLYAWAVGGAVFGVRGSESVFSLPWLGYGMALGMLQLAHLFAPHGSELCGQFPACNFRCWLSRFSCPEHSGMVLILDGS